MGKFSETFECDFCLKQIEVDGDEPLKELEDSDWVYVDAGETYCSKTCQADLEAGKRRPWDKPAKGEK